MRRVLVACCAGLAALSLAAPASAIELGTPAMARPYRSPQNFAFELRGGPYTPKIDDEPGLVGRPFERAFGNDARVALAVEFDWQVLRVPHLGTLGLGAGIGVTSFGADVQTVSGRPSGDETGLSVYPMWAVGVLRADVLNRELHFPFVPYGKIGLGAAQWTAKSTGETSNANGVSGRGFSMGTHMALGVALALDFLDPTASKNVDSAIGINGTYLFGEYYLLNLNGLAGTDPLRVGTASWAVGLAWEF